MKTLLLTPVVMLSMFLLACSDGDDDDADTATTPSPAAEATGADDDGNGDDRETDEPDGLAYVLDTIGEDMDEDELRSHLGPELQDISEDRIADVMFCFPTGVVATVVDTEITRDGEQASMDVTWEVTGAGAAEVERTIEHSWSFERVGGGAGEEDTGYRITGLPEECPHLLEELQQG